MSALDDIRQRAEAATPGTWTTFPITNRSSGLRMAGKAGYAELRPEDAEFIAHARTDIPSLLGALDAVLALADGYKLVEDQDIFDAVNDALERAE